MNRMERALSQNGNNINNLAVVLLINNRMSYQDSSGLGNQPNQSTASGSVPTTVLPPNSRGLPTVEGLSIVLQQAQRLLAEHAVPAISVSSTL